MVYFRKKNNKTTMKPKTIIKKKLWRRFKEKAFNQKVVAIVKNQIARNIENKMTVSAQAIAPLCTSNIGATFSLTWYVLSSWQSAVWQMSQGDGQGQRVGNRIKMKRWIIKGQIQPHSPTQNFSEQSYLQQSYQGYATIYFGRRVDTGNVDTPLTKLLQSGNSAINPLGSSTEMMLPLNKDLYKVYWRKTFKLGSAFGQTVASQTIPNNDFGVCRTFGFDACKYICKNRILKFNDVDTATSDRDLSRLAVWATWRPAVGSLASPNPLAAVQHYYDINITSYGEYEDA